MFYQDQKLNGGTFLILYMVMMIRLGNAVPFQLRNCGGKRTIFAEHCLKATEPVREELSVFVSKTSPSCICASHCYDLGIPLLVTAGRYSR